jgi:NAD(P)H-dependent FMN reductase
MNPTGAEAQAVLDVPVLIGSVRNGRRSADVARVVVDALGRRDGVRAGTIDLAEPELPILRDRTTRADAPPPVRAMGEAVARADGLVIVGRPEERPGPP